MNAPVTPCLQPGLGIRLLAMVAPDHAPDDLQGPLAWLKQQAAQGPAESSDINGMIEQWRESTGVEDAALARIARVLGLNPTECMALALCHAVSTSAYASRAVAWLHGSPHSPFPSPGLISRLDALRGWSSARSLSALLDGRAVECGLLQVDGLDRSVPEARVSIPLPLVLALSGGSGRWPSVKLVSTDSLPLAASVRREAARRARGLGRTGMLLVRSGQRREARAVCVVMAQAIGRRAAFIEGDPPHGLLPWLLIQNAVPVLQTDMAPCEQRKLPDVAWGELPLLVVAGPEGNAELGGRRLASWTVAVPEAEERAALWREHGADPEQAWKLGAAYRHSSARIEELVRMTRSAGDELEAPSLSAVSVARMARRSGHGALGSLAELAPDDIESGALVVPAALRRELHELADRCRTREGLADGLGVSARTRYRAGVRALLVGASGTGKTLACSWLATQLGMPLYRVDLASVTSKYIGETEKNLGDLFARAESAEVMILFDEADALFGKRTEVKDANDRYANQQTNYLLQRIETYDGIVLLTSNSRSRFDSAFTRRLDAILEFPLPSPAERRELWLAHLGAVHDLSVVDLNRLAASCDLAGGHIRNAVLVAAVSARIDHRCIGLEDVLRGISAEYGKLGRQVPNGLSERQGGA